MSPIRPLIVRLTLVALLLTGAAFTRAQDAAPDARVIAMSSTLRLRETPSPTGVVLAELPGGTPLTLRGRLAGGGWLYVQTPDGLTGWVAAGYVTVNIDLSQVAVVDAPTPANNTPASPAPVAENTASAQAVVRAAALRLRAEPSTSAAVLAELPAGTPLTLTGRTPAGDWLRVTLGDDEAITGWVAAAYVRVNISLSGLEVVGGAGGNAAASPTVGGSLTDLRAVFQRGRARGQNPNMFAKIGDSITVAAEMYDPIGRGVYTLGDFGYLQAVIDHFRRGENAFTRVSLAAGSGWTTSTVLDPAFSSPAQCRADEPPLACEYRVARPAFALVMLGTNDVAFVAPDVYAYNLNRIVDVSFENGVVPVLSTIPLRVGFEGQADQYNAIIRAVAAARGVPVWDYYAATIGLPNSGLSGDGVHPAPPPGGYMDAANFTGDNLNYGYVVRNLGALQTLHTLLRDFIR